MAQCAQRLTLALALLAWCTAPAFGQAASTSTISGTVVDSGGGVIPGATVLVTNDAGAKFQVITNSEGAFTIPAVDAGAYKVSVSLSGFKTWTTDVRVALGTPVSLKATLEVGAITEEVTVRTNSEILNTTTATVASTLNADQINRMPTPTRNALNAVTFLPGVNTAGVNRNSTVNGLPESMINITLDGVGNNDNFNKSTDGFFASVTPRQDAIEAVTVTTAVSGANQGGSGGVTIAMQTRSGTNQFSGSGYEYFRHPNMNTNSWSNERNGLPKNDIKLNQFGGRLGGPIVYVAEVDRDTVGAARGSAPPRGRRGRVAQWDRRRPTAGQRRTLGAGHEPRRNSRPPWPATGSTSRSRPRTSPPASRTSPARRPSSPTPARRSTTPCCARPPTAWSGTSTPRWAS